jgi:hypothetical protein
MTINNERPVKIGRNDPCVCGSGKKYKKCCLALADAEQAGHIHTSACAHGHGEH